MSVDASSVVLSQAAPSVTVKLHPLVGYAVDVSSVCSLMSPANMFSGRIRSSSTFLSTLRVFVHSLGTQTRSVGFDGALAAMPHEA